MSQHLFYGIILGLSAGFAPGPLLTLVVSETLQHHIRSGIKVALAPLVTDLPIVVLALLGLAQLSEYNTVLGGLSLVGALFLVSLGWQNLNVKPVVIDAGERREQSLLKGVLTNFLSPHPYLFWIGVG